MVKWDRSVMQTNVPHDVIHDNIRANVVRHLPQMAAHPETQQHVAVVGGGWSLPSTFGALRDLHWSGVPIVALNGAANWLVERNVRPSMFIMLDARDTEENRAFVKYPIPGCKYFLASQCAPAIFDICDGRNVTIYHAFADGFEDEQSILDEHYQGRWTKVPAAGSVGMISIMLLRLLGFRFQHLFGLDSCYSPDGEHHPWVQSQNNDEGSAIFSSAGRKFRCSAWQASQATTFIDILRCHGQHLCLDIQGDGLLAHLLKTGAELRDEVTEQ